MNKFLLSLRELNPQRLSSHILPGTNVHKYIDIKIAVMHQSCIPNLRGLVTFYVGLSTGRGTQSQLCVMCIS
jgi:hypothetical protein